DRDRDTGDGDRGDWSAQPAGGGGEDDLPDISERPDDAPTLAEHLEAQVGAAAPDVATEFIARYLIGLLDEAGYLPVPLREVAGDLGVTIAEAEQALAVVQKLDPTGVGARTLSECLALQAKEADRYDPCMARLIDNLDLVARGEFARLKRMCDVDDEDFADMLAELRGYDPKPGLKFGGGEREPVVPDILVTPGAKDAWTIALNEATLPRLVVNRRYYVELRDGCHDKASKSWLGEKLADANWLIKALDQRQKTILKVAAEIVKQQDGFFRRGVSLLRPLTLRAVAEAIEMHESTVSRVTSNKYLHCDRGTFELKYFFTSGVASSDGEGAVSAEAVKAQIRALCDAEAPDDILSDDALVDLLREKGFDLARRTVAKYREAIGIGSSVQRRRQKKLRMAG
ncbi:MAG: RNA polymerase factor sigma-54, partial [Porphyrobacter sp.]|nr:RNA polymerase factor sigma-54 [Porphyrobacter sp.]